ncbi:glycerophosphocholine cholinephosphodiesterase ENPP6-like isoform X2 [Lineus longissimus]|uniref:glycerophosphocholine cholinephosphodiesterase ENPP6-like isoform X2 n=1 Tax=Lineus longissimus TaxID=88925 RepID=UPI002B4FA941
MHTPNWLNITYAILASMITATSYGDELKDDRKLIMVLFDAFRWDYPYLISGLNGFQRLATEGVRAENLMPEFPTMSWPNHYSLTTGLHIGDHGMMENRMYEPESKKVFDWGSPSYSDPFWWNGGEPIWKKRCRMYYWLGCEVPIRNYTPEYYIKYTDDPGPSAYEIKRSMKETFEHMMENKTDFAGFYFARTDYFAHHQGLFTRDFNETMREADGIITYLLDNLANSNLAETTDVIIFSDHGMTTKDPRKTIWLGNLFNETSWGDSVEWSSIRYSDVCIWPRKGKTKWIHHQLKDKHPHLHVYLKEEIPQDQFWHFKHSRFTPPIFLLADIHWSILGIHHEYRPGGTHGYDNREIDMRGIFYATGPDFKGNYTAKPFANVNIYQIMCQILGIDPSPHNGTWEAVEDMMVTAYNDTKRNGTDMMTEDKRYLESRGGPVFLLALVLLLFILL